MRVRFTLNGNNIDLQVNSSVSHTQDSTLDTVSFDTEFVNFGEPILPMTPFEIITEDEVSEDNWQIVEKERFVVITDQVERVSKIHDTFIHHVVATQNTREFSKHILRNSIFRQIEQRMVAKTNFTGAICLEGADVSPGTNMRWHNNRKFYFFCARNVDFAPLCYVGITSVFKNTTVQKARIYIKSQDVTFNSYANGEYTSPNYDWGVNHWQDLKVYLVRYDYTTNAVVERTVLYLDKQYFRQDMDGNLYFDISTTYFDHNDANYSYGIVPFDANEEKSDIHMGTGLHLPTGSGFSQYTLPAMVKFNIRLEIQGYRYSLYDVVDKIVKQARKTYNGHDTYAICTMPSRSSEQGSFLDSIAAPDLNLSGKDLYTAIAEVFEYIDAVPTLTPDGVLGFEFFNNNAAGEITDLVVSDMKLSLAEENFANKLATKYQNAKMKRPKYYPSRDGFAKISTKDLGVVGSESPIIKVDKPIDYIDSVDLWIASDGNSRFFTLNAPYNCSEITTEIRSFASLGPIDYRLFRLPEPYIDISEAIVTEDVYSLLPAGNSSSIFPDQDNVGFYAKGNDYIDISKLIYTNNGSQSNLMKWAIRGGLAVYFGYFDYLDNDTPFMTSAYIAQNGGEIDQVTHSFWTCWRVKYHAVYDGQVTAETIEEKYDGAIETSMGGSGVDLERLGVNMEGLVSKLANENLTVSIGLINYSDRIRKGQWFEYQGQRYVANVVKTNFTATNNIVTQDIQFIKNYNELSTFIQLEHNKMFYEIDNQLSTKGYENITEYIYISTVEREITITQAETSAISQLALYSIVYGTFDYSIKRSADFCILSVYSNDGDTSQFNLSTVNQVADSSQANIEIPLHTYGFGNNICFEVGFEDEINACNRIVYGTKILGKTTLYTDKDGIADMFDFNFVNESGEYVNADNYPLISKTGDSLIYLSKYHYYKRPNEILHFNFQIAILPAPILDDNLNKTGLYRQIFIGEKFVNRNGILTDRYDAYDYDSYAYLFKFYYSNNDDDKYSINDKKGAGTRIDIMNIEWIPMLNAYALRLTLNQSVTAKYWAITDFNNDIYISSNEGINSNQLILYVKAFRKRL